MPYNTQFLVLEVFLFSVEVFLFSLGLFLFSLEDFLIDSFVMGITSFHSYSINRPENFIHGAKISIFVLNITVLTLTALENIFSVW